MRSSDYDISDPLISLNHKKSRKTPVGGFSKRVFDVVFACIALGGGAIVFAVILISVRLTSPGPVFFRHERMGHNGKPFSCYKFRTMRADAEEVLESYLNRNPDARQEFERDRKLKNDPRIIPFIGHFLRRTSLDELPQFYNVLKGEMSVVGPRPVIRAELAQYGDRAVCYKAVRPGITGLWQVSGRNLLSFSERVEIDAEYVRTWTFRRDLKITLQTCGVVLFRTGAY